MKLKGIETKKGTLEMLQALLKHMKVHGVFYTNDFFSQRYLCRAHVLSDEVNVEDQVVKLKIATRVESVGLWELENTLDLLVRHSAGDIPGYQYLEENPTVPVVPEPISLTHHLYSIDLLLIMKEPSITYQSVIFADSKFVLMNIDHVLELDGEEFQQRVTLLLGVQNRMNFFSHFHKKELTGSDLLRFLEFIIDENITGKAITMVKVTTKEGVTSAVTPFGEMISAWTTANDAYAFGTGTGYVRIPYEEMMKCKLTVKYDPFLGHVINITNGEVTLELLMEN